MANELQKYFVVKVDILSLTADPDNPGHSVAYTNRKVAAPELLEPSYDNMSEAVAAVEKLMESGRGEDIEITLANGQAYKGPRYFYYTAQG